MWHFGRLCFKSGKPILTGNLFSRHYLIYGCTTKGKNKDMEILHIVMPAYNEEANIEKVIDSWYPNLGDNENSRLVIADSGSTDRTHQILCGLKEKYSRLVILTDTKKQHGPKVIALYNYAIKNGAEYIFQTDSDGQTNPDEFAAFWEKRKKHDAIIGMRLTRGDGKSRWLVERVLCMLLKFIFNVKVPDANAPFRLMKTELVEKYLYRLPADYNLPNVMLTTYFVAFMENVEFLSISFKPRQGGVNSINLLKIVKIGWSAIKDFYRLKKKMKRDIGLS